jgi:hypothetical protein
MSSDLPVSARHGFANLDDGVFVDHAMKWLANLNWEFPSCRIMVQRLHDDIPMSKVHHTCSTVLSKSKVSLCITPVDALCCMYSSVPCQYTLAQPTDRLRLWSLPCAFLLSTYTVHPRVTLACWCLLTPCFSRPSQLLLRPPGLPGKS